MKTLIVLVLATTWGALAAAPADLSGVQKVYLMPMSNGLDQHLADQIARHSLCTVVVDPKQANAIWTERIDPSFFNAFNELFPPPKADNEKEKKKDESLEAAERPPSRGSWGRTRGTIFLIGVASRQVLWSTFLPLEDTSPKGLHRTAQDIVKNFKRDTKPNEPRP